MSAVILPRNMELTSLAVNADLDALVQATPVQFVGGVDARYQCASCSSTLRQPCQTPCGHRICRPCADALFAAADGSRLIRCPGNELDCVSLAREAICPDFSAMREMKTLPVYCVNSCRGCKAQPPFGKLKEHLNSCKFNLQQCVHCSAEIPAVELDNHIKQECRQFPVSCRYNCNVGKLPRFKMTEHEPQCPRKPHKCKFSVLGCTFQAPKCDLDAHENDSAAHSMVMMQYLVKQHSEQLQMTDKQQSLEADLILVSGQLRQYASENAELKSTVQTLTSNIQSLESALSSRSQTIATLTTKLTMCESQYDRQSHELQQVKDRQQELTTTVRELSRLGASPSAALPEELRKQMITYDRTVGLHDVRLSELDLRCQCLETANYDGVLVWKISDYVERKRQAVEGRVLSLYSQPFYSSRYGYKMCARVYLNGDGAGRNTHLSLFFVVMQGDYDELLAWPFRQRVTLSLLDQRNNRRHIQDTFRPDPTSASFQKPRAPMNVASGCPLFASHTTLEETDGPYLVDNLIFIRVTVDTADLLNP